MLTSFAPFRESPFKTQDFQAWLGHCRQLVRLGEVRFRGVQPRQRMEWDAGPYRLKTVETWQDLKRILRLRHQVFHEEHHGRSLPLRLDVDPIDFVCDHLGLFCKVTGEAIGSYRITDSFHSREFYAQKRFEFRRFLDLPGRKLELGRACVHREHRKGATLAWLWRGLCLYAEAVGADYLFGSASIRTDDWTAAEKLYEDLGKRGLVDKEPFFFPISGCSLHEFAAKGFWKKNTELLPVPSLFDSYLRAGAKVAGAPAVDLFLGSVDFPIVIQLDAMHGRFQRRYRRRA